MTEEKTEAAEEKAAPKKAPAKKKAAETVEKTPSTYAIIKATGRSLVVREGQRVEIEYTGEESALPENIEFTEVMLGNKADADEAIIGTPYIKGASVKAKVLGSKRGKKQIAFKKKRRQGFTKKKGSRAELVELEVTEIQLP